MKEKNICYKGAISFNLRDKNDALLFSKLSTDCTKTMSKKLKKFIIIDYLMRLETTELLELFSNIRQNEVLDNNYNDKIYDYYNCNIEFDLSNKNEGALFFEISQYNSDDMYVSLRLKRLIIIDYLLALDDNEFFSLFEYFTSNRLIHHVEEQYYVGMSDYLKDEFISDSSIDSNVYDEEIYEDFPF